ncbi:hypothetical protein PIB30_097583 [Stylosanthes scabra]|uniref:Peptidase A1 domain-containing protein n=1 Tax=Stylosanthes scabra TaxID=79078 RepID=A0ABU6YWZ9_9FABA|nr:hypothetical protein [Stylosanthes scabra]
MATSSVFHHHFILLSTLLVLFSSSLPPSQSAVASQKELPKSGYITLPIKLDPTKHQYYTSLPIGTPPHNINFAIDIQEKALWYDCGPHYTSSSYKPIPCATKQCPTKSCIDTCEGFPRKLPGCTNNTCAVDYFNIFDDSLFSSDLGEDLLYIPGVKIPRRFLSLCANSELFQTPPLTGFAKGIGGALGLGRNTPLSLPIQISSTYNVIPKFTLCLPSSIKNSGILFIGGSPYHLINSLPNHVPFVTSAASNEYYIDVKSVNIDGKAVKFASKILRLDKLGIIGGTKFSTLRNFTVLHPSIYKPFVSDFVRHAKGMKMKSVKAVKPFGACFDGRSIGKKNGVLDVPRVDLVLDSKKGVSYEIDGHKSLIEVKKGVKCLAFVEGGKDDDKAGIVIGGYQMEDRVFEFDLSTSILSFGSSLLLHNATCSSN